MAKKSAQPKKEKKPKKEKASFFGSLESTFGKGLIKHLSGNQIDETLRGFSFGCPSLNYICTGNIDVGLVNGKIYEIFGPESAGKTTLCLNTVRDCQRQKELGLRKTANILFVDAEHAISPSYARKLGVNTDLVTFSQPDWGEQALDILNAGITGGADLCLVDSVAALVPRAIWEAKTDKQTMGMLAKMMSQALAKISKIANKHQVPVLFTNQTREKVGVFFGSPETTTGGKALKFYASVRLRGEIRTSKAFGIHAGQRSITGDQKKKKRLGSLAEIKCIKNKLYDPFLETTIPLIFGKGYDSLHDTYSMAGRAGVIEPVKGKGWKFGKKRISTDIKDMELNRNDVYEVLRKVDFAKLEIFTAEPEAEEPDEEGGEE